MKAALQTFTVILLFTLAGCLVAPVPSFGHKVASGKRIQAEDLSFVQPGETTRDDVVKSLGEPWAHYQDLGVMVYYWETLEGHWIWGIWAIEASAGGAEEITRLHYLFIQLDERDRVQRYEFIKSPNNVPTKDLAIQWSKKNAQHTKALP